MNDVARAVRLLTAGGVMDMNGHASRRNGSTFLINSRKASRSTVRAGDIVEVDIATGRAADGADEPPSEVHIHREIFLRRPDVGAVVHAHPQYVLTLSVAGHDLVPVTSVGSFLPERTPVFDDANLINSAERGRAVAAALGDGCALVLRGHGLVITGATLEEAVVRFFCAEENARIQYRAALLGRPHVLTGAELDDLRDENWRPIILRKHWTYHLETARSRGTFAGLEAES
ncbi:MAG: class II aldolase/adducin family protein [Candidatus Velthaea sp.]